MRTPVLERLFAGHHDILSALRSLRRSPGFVAIAVLSLGLAIGLNTTMLAMVDAIMHPYVPYANADRLFTLTPYGMTREKEWLQGEMYRDAAARKDLYAQIVPYKFDIGIIQAGSHTISGFVFTAGTRLFDVLGVKPMVGRTFNTLRDDPADATAAVITYRAWQEEFGGDSDLTALHLTFKDHTYSVIGVMPPSVTFPGTEFWLPMSKANEASIASNVWINGLVQLKPGDTQPRVKSQLDAMATQIASRYHANRKDFDYRLESIIPTGGMPRGVTWFASAITVVILLVACLNLANLMLARGLGRRRELAVRMAIGATRRDIVRHVLTECVLLAGVGGLWGVLLSVWGVSLAQQHMPNLIRQLGFVTPHLSWRVVAIGLVVTALTVVVAGLAPAFHAARSNAGDAIKDGGGGSTGRPSRLYRLVVVGEIGLALSVMIVAMVFVGIYVRQANYKFPYDAEHVVTGMIEPSGACSAVDAGGRFWFDMTKRVAGVPGVRYAAATAVMLPVRNTVTSDQPGTPIELILGQGTALGYLVTTPDYFRVYGYPIIEGRDFEPGDADSAGAAIVDRHLARKLWPLTSPVGRLIKLGASNTNAPWVRVVGVVGALGEKADSATAGPPRDLTIVRPFGCARATMSLRTGGGTGGGRRLDVAGAAYHLLRATAPAGSNVAELRSDMEDYDASLRIQRTATLACLACGLFGLLLSAVGIFGVLSYAVGQRSREFAMRTALGAQAADIVRIVARDAMEMVLGGTALGEIVAVVLAFSYLQDAGSTAFVLALIAAELIVVAATLAATIGPVRRALRSDPVELLRAT